MHLKILILCFHFTYSRLEYCYFRRDNMVSSAEMFRVDTKSLLDAAVWQVNYQLQIIIMSKWEEIKVTAKTLLIKCLTGGAQLSGRWSVLVWRRSLLKCASPKCKHANLGVWRAWGSAGKRKSKSEIDSNQKDNCHLPVLNTSTLSYCLCPRTLNWGNVKSLLNSTASPSFHLYIMSAIS